MKPRLFIGSSSEGAKLCGALTSQLRRIALITPWHRSFPLSKNTIDSLLRQFQKHDFGIFILSPDDVTELRGKDFATARDNVVFEAGLFMGMHGKGRAFVLVPSGLPDFHMLSDLEGFTPATYDIEDAKRNLDSALTHAAYEIETAITETLKEQPDIAVNCRITRDERDETTYTNKLHVSVRNPSAAPVYVESLQYAFATGAPASSLGPVIPHVVPHNVLFHTGFTFDRKDIYSTHALVQPNQTVTGWVPLLETTTEAKLKELFAAKAIGNWTYRCNWLGREPGHGIAIEYERTMA